MTENIIFEDDVFEIQNSDGLSFLDTVGDNSIDLILTDPPYIISKESGMNSLYNSIENNIKNGIEYVKTETQWETYKEEHKIENDDKKINYMKYGEYIW